jgi:hypothetical protein
MRIKKPAFLEAGSYFVVEFYIQFPPPDVAGIIITTTIMIAVIMDVMLLTLLFCMKDVIIQI